MELRELIRTLAWGNEEIYCKICTVEKVDKQARTIDCQPIDDEDAPILGVNLQANQESAHGIVVFPKQGSYVVVAFLSAAVAVMVLADEVESIEAVIDDNKMSMDKDGARVSIGHASAEIDANTTTIKVGDTVAELNRQGVVFNDGKLGGLVVVGSLTEKLNQLRTEFNAFVSIYNAHIHDTTATVGSDPAPGVISPPPVAAQEATPFVRSEYENEKVKH